MQVVSITYIAHGFTVFKDRQYTISLYNKPELVKHLVAVSGVSRETTLPLHLTKYGITITAIEWGDIARQLVLGARG